MKNIIIIILLFIFGCSNEKKKINIDYQYEKLTNCYINKTTDVSISSKHYIDIILEKYGENYLELSPESLIRLIQNKNKLTEIGTLAKRNNYGASNLYILQTCVQDNEELIKLESLKFLIYMIRNNGFIEEKVRYYFELVQKEKIPLRLKEILYLEVLLVFT